MRVELRFISWIKKIEASEGYLCKNSTKSSTYFHTSGSILNPQSLLLASKTGNISNPIPIIELPTNFESAYKEFVKTGKTATTHPAKLAVLANFLDKAFGVKLIELLPGIEKKVGSKIFGVKGSIDLLFSYVVFELKTDFATELEDAKIQIKKYFQSLYEQSSSDKFIGIATDLSEFVSYVPVIKNNQVSDIREIDRIIINTTNSYDSLLWIDKFFFSRKGIRPTAEDLNLRFGPNSPIHALIQSELEELWNEVNSFSEVSLKLKLWQKNMNIVYGEIPSQTGFLDQTFLVTLVKLLVYLRLSNSRKIGMDVIEKALTGEYFASFGISNLIEEDYFSWILNPKILKRTLEIGQSLTKELLKYDISRVDEDLFKEIYQNIVNKATRHGTGETYTPEWLAEVTLMEAQNALGKRSTIPTILDPSCGSGTFLTNAISFLKELLSKNKIKPNKILEIILKSVVGIDLNPLAVIIARANYVLTLGNLMNVGKRITIPVYVADSVKIPHIVKVLAGATDVYEVDAENVRLQLPSRIFSDSVVLQKVLDTLTISIHTYRERKDRKEAEAVLKNQINNILKEDEIEIVTRTLQYVMNLVDKNLNSIWIFYLKNIYAPTALKETKFDIIVGNPPWIVMRSIENENYQNFLKGEVQNYGLIPQGKNFARYMTHMEMATLFFCRTSDLYLKKMEL